MTEHALFTNRKAVGTELAATLSQNHYVNPVVLALPRGGVPIAAEIAKQLHAPMDLLLVQKIGVPGHEELALGAVIDGPAPLISINENIKRLCNISDAQIKDIEEQKLKEIERRRSLYLHGHKPVAIRDCTAIIVDDGIATGATVRAAVSAVHKQAPHKLVLAMGVAPPEVVGTLYAVVNEIVCLNQPDPFHSVGSHFLEFAQVSDQEVIDLLDEVNEHNESLNLQGR